jgi:hypothetical protein
MDDSGTDAMIKVGDSARIDCPASHYHGVIGEVYEIQVVTQYAILDMPKGIQLERENTDRNIIIERLKSGAKSRKIPRSRWPKGDPMWVPLRWLRRIPVAPGGVDIVSNFLPRS